MKWKKILILFICLVCQLSCVAIEATETDAIQSADFQNIMQNVRRRNAEIQSISTRSVPTIIAPTPKPAPISIPTTVSQQQLIEPDSIVIPTMPESTIISAHISNKQIKYNKILEIREQIFKDKDNTNLHNEYIKAVEDYLNIYGYIQLKLENKNNYYNIMWILGYFYEENAHTQKAITTYEKLLSDFPNEIELKKDLLILYDETKSCIKAKNILSQIKANEPNFDIDLYNCVTTPENQNLWEIELQKSTKEENKYDWDSLYILYFSLWIIVIIFGVNLEGIRQYLMHSSRNIKNYNIKFDNNNCPIKPSIEEFGFSKRTFDDTVDIINLSDDFNRGLSFCLMPLSMFLFTILFSAPHYYFPIFFNTGFWGILGGIIFWIFTAYITDIIKNKIPVLTNIANIKNYNAYNRAIDLYNNAKYDYDKEMQRQKLEYERKLREQEEQKRRQLEQARLEQERKQRELEKKRKIQEEYRKRQIENQRLEQERKQRELEEQKRKVLARTLRLQEKYWRKMKWDVFEHEIGELFKDLGYQVTVTRGSGDGGIDVIVERDNKVIAVQCKHYKKRVGAPVVQAFWGAKDYFEYKGKYIKADGAIMVALSGVTEPAEKIIQHFTNYELWTIDTILAKAREVNYRYS